MTSPRRVSEARRRVSSTGPLSQRIDHVDALPLVNRFCGFEGGARVGGKREKDEKEKESTNHHLGRHESFALLLLRRPHCCWVPGHRGPCRPSSSSREGDGSKLERGEWEADAKERERTREREKRCLDRPSIVGSSSSSTSK